MTKFLHFADAHLGIENYGRYDVGTGLHSRLNDFIQSLSTTIDIAIEEKVDFALFCGDAYKNNNPSPTYQREFARQIYRLSKEDIPTVLINGNHDNSLTFGRASALDIFQTLRIPNIHVIIEPSLIHLRTGKSTIQIIGIPWPTRNQYLEKEEYRDSEPNSMNQKIQKRLIKTMTQLMSQLDSQYPRLLAGHLTVAEAIFSGSENYAVIGNDPVIPVQFFIDSPLDYIALGHIHRYQNLNPAGKPPVVYSGSMERINFGEEKEDKGFCIGSIDEKGKADYEFISLPTRNMFTIEVKIRDAENPTAALITEIEKYDLKNAIVRVHYEISEDQVKKLDFKKIDQALGEAFLVAGITRNVQKKSRAGRSSLSEEMDVLSALREYIQLQDWQSWEKDLKETTHDLQQELSKKDDAAGGAEQ